MDPLSAIGLAANVVQIIDSVVKLVGYINDVKDAPKERARLARESVSLLAFLTDFRIQLEESSTDDPWFTSVKTLGEPDGPLEQFRDEMEDFARKLRPQSGLRKFGRSLVWTLDRNDISHIIWRIERLKALVSLSRQEDHFKLSLEIKTDIDKLKHGAGNEKKGRERQEIVAWISDVDFSAKQSDYFGRSEPGTGDWFICNDAFRTWLDADCGTLWCSGLPGAGKTIITSIVVDHLEQKFALDHVAIAYVYCNYKEQADQTATSLVKSILQQLVRQDAILSDEITSSYQLHHQRRTQPTLAEWSSLLEMQVGRFARVFILIDALDELSETTRDSFLAEIQLLQDINVMVTSRPGSTMENELENTQHLEIRASDDDVRKYLDGRAKRERRLARLLRGDRALTQLMMDTIIENAQGMFLLAQLQMDAVARKHSNRDIRKALASLPRELNNTYDDAMRRIWSQSEEDVKLAETVLSWISHAFRPLDVAELQHALAVENGDTSFDESGIPDEEFVVSVCAGLVTVDQESRIIRLVHHTTQEYFESVRMSRFPYAQISISTTCLTYLSFDDFAQGPCGSDEELEGRLLRYPLLRYAAVYWGDHARGITEESLEEQLLKFLRKESNLLASAQVFHYVNNQFQTIQGAPTTVSGLHLAASFGLSGIVRSLLRLGEADPNSRDSAGRTPLSLAAEHGYESVALQLIENGSVDLDSADIEGRTPLAYAAANGHATVLSSLLQRKEVNPNIQDKYFGQTPLWQAADAGHKAVVEVLLGRRDVDPNRKDKIYGHTPLWRAVDGGHEGAVRFLLQRDDIDVNCADKYYGRTPLWLAADRGDVGIVRLLLERKDIDKESTDRYSGQTPLWHALEREDKAVANVLLSFGALGMSEMP